jgi:pantothenate synthetase
MDAEPRVRLDYLALRSDADLAPLPAGPVMSGRVLIAAYLGDPETKETRLIDNMLLSEKATVGSMAALPN